MKKTVNPIIFNNPADNSDDNAGKRVGARIREIRIARDLTQAQLGEQVGLTADRIQKYENGARKPKSDLLDKISTSLDVDTLALSDPVFSNPMGVMYGLFELEKNYGLRIESINNRLILSFGDGHSGIVNQFLRLWEEEYSLTLNMLESATSEEERLEIQKQYAFWKWNFARSQTKEAIEHRLTVYKEALDSLLQKYQELNDGNKDS